jgi:hypothetical protein
MSQSRSKNPDAPFDGLLLPMSAWKALEDAHITNLQQLKGLAPLIDRILCIGPETATVIRDRLNCLASRRTIRVRLIFPKLSQHKAASALSN